MAEQNIIALVFDCDETLCDDTTDLALIELDQDLVEFWAEVTKQIERDNWSPPLAYMTEFLRVFSEKEPKATLNDLNGWLRAVSKKVAFYPGVGDMLRDLQELLGSDPDWRKAEVRLEYFVISGGFEELIKATDLTKNWGIPSENIIGCNFGADRNGRLTPKSSITFTEKTKFLYAINKGIPFPEIKSHPDAVNRQLDSPERRIPFANMIYVGDGYSDIPCFSMLNQYGGVGIGVFSERAYRRGYELAVSRRISAGPYSHEYVTSSDLRKFLEERIRAVADSIADRHHATLGLSRSPLSVSKIQVKLETLRRNAESLGINVREKRVAAQKEKGRALAPEEEVKLLEGEINGKAGHLVASV